MSLLSTAFHAALTETGQNFKQWADAAGITYTTAINCLQRDSRPNDELLRAFVIKWPRPDIGINILRAYLRDEVRRAGVSSTDVEILLPGELEGPSLDKALVVLREWFLRYPDLAEPIKKMARIALEEMEASKPPQRPLGYPPRKLILDRHVAEESGAYYPPEPTPGIARAIPDKPPSRTPGIPSRRRGGARSSDSTGKTES